MLSDTQAQALLLNKANDLSTQYTNIAVNQSSAIKNDKTNSYKLECKIQTEITTNKIAVINSQNGSVTTTRAQSQIAILTTEVSSSLLASQQNYTNDYDNNIDQLYSNIDSNYYTSLNSYASTISTTADLTSSVTSYSSTFTSNLTTLAVTMKKQFVNTLTIVFNNTIAIIGSIGLNFNNSINKLINDVNS